MYLKFRISSVRNFKGHEAQAFIVSLRILDSSLRLTINSRGLAAVSARVPAKTNNAAANGHTA